MKTHRKKRWLSTSALAFLAVALPAVAAPQSAPASSAPIAPPAPVAPKGAPNVLLIMTDDVGFAATSPFGGPIPTPAFDQVAKEGARFNAFNTTALCSPTRAALLTGRNAHSVSTGMITEMATPDKGYTSVLPKSAATIGRVLRDNGYNTAWFGKNHNTPDWETGPAGPFDRWPTGLGFEYFYGFNAGDTDQWAPALVENTRTVEPPTQRPSYILDRDLADHAIDWLRSQHSTAPAKPFLMYYAPGTAHAPHHAPPEWIDRFKGQFDMGWDAMREASFARQKALGVIPASAKLTPRPDQIPAWSSLSADQRRLYSRMMEAYAGALAFADHEIGRVLDELRRSGQLDNTIVIYIQGDNGASGEGGLQGTTSEMSNFNGIAEPLDFTLSHIDDLGGPNTFNHYPVGWAWAMNTPFQWTKQIASHLGGIRNGMAIAWPGHIDNPGSVRSHFGHVVDVVPTLYEAIGIEPPERVDGIQQQPIEGTSFLPALQKSSAPEPSRTQYFEMLGNRALYRDGWIASTTPQRVPWALSGSRVDPQKFEWELYNTGVDYSQARNLATSHPERLQALVAQFDQEAKKHDVYPLSAATAERFASSLRPYPLGKLNEFTFYPGDQRYPNGAFPDIRNRSWTVATRLSGSDGPANGMIMAQGGKFGGWGLLVRSGKPEFIYRRSNQPIDLTRLTAPEVLSPGPHELSIAFASDGGRLGAGGLLSLKVDGQEVATTRLSATVPVSFPLEGATIGYDTGTAIDENCPVPCRYEGLIDRVDVTLR